MQNQIMANEVYEIPGVGQFCIFYDAPGQSDRFPEGHQVGFKGESLSPACATPELAKIYLPKSIEGVVEKMILEKSKSMETIRGTMVDLAKLVGNLGDASQHKIN